MTPDVYAACEVLEKNGVTFHKKPDEVGVRVLYARVMCSRLLARVAGTHERPRVRAQPVWLLVRDALPQFVARWPRA